MSVRIEVRYEGELHTTARHGPSGATLETDAPKDNEGRGEAFSPTDLLATALGSCMLTVMGILARRKGWAIEGARARVEKHMVAQPVCRIGKLVVELDMESLEQFSRTLDHIRTIAGIASTETSCGSCRRRKASRPRC